MAIQKADAIVLKAEHFREKSLLITLYTYQFGKIKGVLKGRTSIQSPSYVEVIFYPHKKGLHFISECNLKSFFIELNESLLALGAANYFSELVDKLTFPEYKNRRLFNLLLLAISFLAKKNIFEANIKRFISIFEIKLLNLLGFFPYLNACVHCGKKFNVSKRIKFSVLKQGFLCTNCISFAGQSKEILPGTLACLSYLRKESIKKGLLLKICPQIDKQIKETLQNLLAVHLQKKLKSQEFLEKIN